MRLSRIEIENFKGVGARQAIELRPITLLFGPNSAGKSTILQALHYVREILERKNPDPDQTIAGGQIDLGGFKNLIHNHDLSKAMTIKQVIDLSDDQGNEQLSINNGNALGSPEFENLRIRYIVGENTETAHYHVSVSTVVKLMLHVSITGSVEPVGQGCPRGIGNLAPVSGFLKDQVDAVPDITMPELGPRPCGARMVSALRQRP